MCDDLSKLSDNELLMTTKLHIAGMKRDLAQTYFAAFKELSDEYENKIPKGTKIFEVHHALSVMRRKFYIGVIQGKTAVECKESARLGQCAK